MKAYLKHSGKLSCAVIFVIYYLKVIGLAPFSISNKGSSDTSGYTSTWAIDFSKLGLGYNIFISILFPTSAAFAYYKIVATDYINKSSLTQATDVLQDYLVIGATVIVLISWTVKQRKAICIVERLLDIDARLFRTEIRPSYRKPLVFLSVHVFLTTFLWIFTCVMSNFVYVVTMFPNSILAFLPSIVVCWYTIQYSMVIGLITVELESVNKNLLNLKKMMNYSYSNPLLSTYLDAFNLSIPSQLTLLQSLQSIRLTLSEISRDVSAFFSFTMLPCFANYFVMLVSNFYYLITPVVVPNSSFEPAAFSGTMVWILICIYPITSLAFNVTEILQEAKSTGRIVHTLLAASKKLEVKKQLEQFSLHLLHDDFNFTAYGFFTLDFTLLHAMVGSAATYIIICIQFQQKQYLHFTYLH